MSTDLVDCTIEAGVATLTLNNPPLNLVTLELTARLDERLAELERNDAVRVLVVTGAGTRAFCAGSDIAEFPQFTDPDLLMQRKIARENAVYSRLDDFPKPTIAAVRGLAFGGGLELAVCCDLLVVEANVRLALPEVKLGVIAGSGGTVRVTRRIGEGRAKELMFLGEPIDAQTALAWGLVNRVVARGEALAAAADLARELAQRPNKALQICKRAIDLAFDMDEDGAIRRTLELSAAVFATDDCKEGVRAFFAREKPRFTHR
ncbi:MAG: enoyl-CoA hydratase/isomerase family protein [Geminicoccaceae bacterium]|nr:enoyl-CoA hydratase/isomerase family protein [Geminicoccaceae bacterium]